MSRKLIEQHYSLADIALLLGLHKSTVSAAVKSGQIKPVRVIGNKQIVPVSAVNAWIESNTSTWGGKR